MRKADMFQALFTSLYTLYSEVPEEERDAGLGEYIKKYMPNFTTGEPAADDTVLRKFRKFVDKRNKDDNISEEDAYKIAQEFVHETTDFSDIFRQLPLYDWVSLCDLINMSNTVNAVNNMKDSGEYQSFAQSGRGDGVADYLADHPDLMSRANPQIAADFAAGMAGMPMSSSSAAKKTVHPSKKKKKKKKK
ncbi:MAG: hypothetical protein K5767_01030 [Clostridia bacterium]|nr:hypothetical protein [Clostridia bacterium]